MPNIYDKKGVLHSVDTAQQAEAMVKSGDFAFPPGQKVQVEDASGRVFDVDASEAPAAFAQGLGMASPEAVHKVENQETYGGAGGAIASMGFHGLDALGLNAATEALIQSKAKLHGVDPDVIRQEVLGLREANPIASGIGTGLGLAAPALLSGGGALAADAGPLTKGLYGAGRVLTAPGRAVGALGEAAGGIAGGILGEEGAGFLSKLAVRSGVGAAQGAAELGAYGGASTIGESSLGDDHELTAEKFWAGVGNGALAGLLGGAGLGAVSAGGSAVWSGAKDMLAGARGRGKDIEALAARTFGESAEGLGSAYSKASAALSGKDAEAIRGLTRLDAEGREARRLAVFEGDSVRAESARELRSNINQINEATKNLSPEWREAKAANVAKTIAREPEAIIQQSELAQNALGAARSKLDEMAADPVMFDQRLVKKLAKPLETAEKRLGVALESGKPEDVFVALDTFKRDMGPLGKGGMQVGMPSIERDTKKEVLKLYEDMRGALTDPMWGKAGQMQADVNAAYEKWLGTKNLFDQRFTTETGKVGWEKTYGADPAKIDAYVNGLTSPKNDLTHSIIEQHIAATKTLAAELAKAGEMTPAKAAELAAVRKGAEDFSKTIGKAEKSLVLTNQLRELERTDNGAGAGVLGAVGGMVGGPIGAAAGAALGALANPARVVRQLAAVERIAARVDAGLGEGVKAFVHGEAVGATKAIPKGTVAERFARESQAVRQFAQNPTLATDRITKSFAGLNSVAPSVATQLAFKATRAAQVLAQTLPQGSTPGGIVPQFSKVRYSDADMQRWLRKKEVIENPVDTLINGMAANHLSPSDMALIQEHSPKLYKQFTQTALAELSSVKNPPTYQRKIMLGVLLGVPADKTLEPAFIQMTQGAYQNLHAAAQQQAGKRPRGGSVGSLAQHGATASEAVEGR